LGTEVTDAFLKNGDVVYGISRSGGDRTAEKLHGIAADLTSPNVPKEIMAHIMRSAKHIDVLVHVLGGFAGGKTVQETPDDLWNKMIQMNLNAAFYVFRAAIPYMKDGGRIVAIGSRAGVLPAAGLAAYSVSKAGLNALVVSMADELKDKRITANVVLPSTIDTAANRSWGSPADQSKWVTPQAIAQHVLWLASPQAGDISGAMIPVYGRA
jgi:NAD(P)-dependent dehydrogenase (short-subunit alcohol dehydrogenase family)